MEWMYTNVDFNDIILVYGIDTNDFNDTAQTWISLKLAATAAHTFSSCMYYLVSTSMY